MQATEDLVSDSAERKSANAWGKFHGFKKQLGTHDDGKRLLVECERPDVGPSSCELFSAGRISLKDPSRAPLDSGERARLTSSLVGESAVRLSHSLPAGKEIKTNDFSLGCAPGAASSTLTGIAIYALDQKFVIERANMG